MAVVGTAAPLNALEIVAGLALGVVIVALLAALGRGLLGLRVGWVRLMVAAAAIGYTIAALVSQTLSRPVQPLAFLSVLIGISVLVTMAGLVVAEAVVPSGSRPVREVRRRVARMRRDGQITAIAARHGLDPLSVERLRVNHGISRVVG